MIKDSACASRYVAEKASLRLKVASHLRESMTSLIGNPNFADLELHSNDDLHLPAHSCILRCRAPEFFSSNIGVNFDYEKSSSIVSKTVINVSTMDSDHLSKFVQHVYAGSDDDEVVATSDGEPLGLINEEALFGSSESRQSARTYICESSSTNVASWDGTFGENNENGNSLEIGSQSKSNECLACENTECFGECTTVRTSTQKSLEKRIGCETISDVAQGEVFPSEDNHLRSQEKAEPSDRPLAQASKGATLFPLFYTMDFSSSGDIRIYNSEALHSSLPRSKNPRAKSKSPIAVDSSVAKQGSMQSLNTITQTTMLLTEHSSSSQTLCTPCSKLGVSLLSMFRKGQDSDCIVLAKGDKFKAHKCILAAVSPYFSTALSSRWLEKGDDHMLDLSAFSSDVVEVTLSFIYGGVLDVPEVVNLFELHRLADFLHLDMLKQLAVLEIRAIHCHYFHQPCSQCTTYILKHLKSFSQGGYADLLEEALNWQANYFSSVWRTKSFSQLSDEQVIECYHWLSKSLNSDNVLKTFIECENIIKSSRNQSDVVSSMLAQISEHCVEVMATQFSDVLSSDYFLEMGKGFALDLPTLEDLFPTIVHSLQLEEGCLVLVKLYNLKVLVCSQTEANEVEWNEKFVHLLKRLYELCDARLIHHANMVINCRNWSLLTLEMQNRIRETGIFVDFSQPTGENRQKMIALLQNRHRRHLSNSRTKVDVKRLPTSNTSAKFDEQEKASNSARVEPKKGLTKAPPQSSATAASNTSKGPVDRKASTVKKPSKTSVNITSADRKNVRQISLDKAKHVSIRYKSNEFLHSQSAKTKL